MPSPFTTTFAGATASSAGWGSWDRIIFGNAANWGLTSTWTIDVLSSDGPVTFGKGRIAGGDFICAITLNNRVYLGVGSSFAFSENNDPTLWEVQNPGAGKISIQNQAGFIDKVYGLSSFQGRLAVFGRYNISIWNIDADPNNFSRAQLLQNLGVIAPLSVQALGDLDVLFLDATGIRSLRAREVTLNATPSDIGTPIDKLIQALLVSSSSTVQQAACAVVEPNEKRYWLGLNGYIFVLSYYPSSQITAWSTYDLPQVFGSPIASNEATNVFPAGGTLTYSLSTSAVYLYTKGNSTEIASGNPNPETVLTESGQFTPPFTHCEVYGTPGTTFNGSIRAITTFNSQVFKIHQGRVYMLGNDNIVYIYGGSDNNTYDQTQVTAEIPWLDNKQPATRKQAIAVDAALSGAWTIKAGMDPKAGTLETVMAVGDVSNPNENVDSPFDGGSVPYVASGTHFKFQAVSDPTSTKIAVLSGLILHYNQAESD